MATPRRVGPCTAAYWSSLVRARRRRNEVTQVGRRAIGRDGGALGGDIPIYRVVMR